MYAIVTKYLPPTNHKGARITATCHGGSRTFSWEYERDVKGNHDSACAKLRAELDADVGGGSYWSCEWTSGQLPDGRYAHVFAPTEDEYPTAR